jgi:hypothetical protein
VEYANTINPTGVVASESQIIYFFWGNRVERLCHALGKKKFPPIQTPRWFGR